MKSKWAPWCWWTGVVLFMGAGCTSSEDNQEDDMLPGWKREPYANGGGGAGDGGEAFDHTCTNQRTDPATGLAKCEEGYWHRPTAVKCGPPAGAGGEGGSLGSGGGGAERLPRAGSASCDPEGEGDCVAFEHGFCKGLDGGGGAFGACQSGCTTDADCGTGFICLCDEPGSPTGGACRPSNCRTDANCGHGLLCAYYESDGCNPSGFACQLPKDECQSDADCVEGKCNWRNQEQRHFCDQSICEN